MNLVISNKQRYDKYFIKVYLPKYLLKSIYEHFDRRKVLKMEEFLDINILSLFKYALLNLVVKESWDSYIISINKNKLYKGYNLNRLIDYVTYGSRSEKGYSLFRDTFGLVEKNIDRIYEEWLNGS